MSWTTKNIKDAGNNNVSMRVWDESGAGSGPFSFAHMSSNGAGGGAQMATETTVATLALETGGNLDTAVGSLASIEADIANLASGSIEPGLAGTPSADVLSTQPPYAPLYAAISTSSSGATSIVAASSGNRIRVIAWDVVVNDAVNFKWQSASTDLTGLYYMAGKGGGVARSGNNPDGYFQTANNEALNLNLSGAVAVGGSITYVLVPA